MDIEGQLNYLSGQMNKWADWDDTDEAHQYADGVLIDLINTLARHANVSGEQGAYINRILADFEKMDKWYA